MYLIKNQQVKNVKQLLHDERQRLEQQEQVNNQNMNERRHMINSQRLQARAAVEGFRWNRSKDVFDDNKNKADLERKMIYDYEIEARELELMEADLIERLHKTQVDERQAFMELEEAMINASMPKKDRLQVIHEMNDNEDTAASQMKTSSIRNSHHQQHESMTGPTLPPLQK